MSAKLPRSPLAPKKFPDMPPVAGVRLAVAASGMRYQGRDDLLLMAFDKGTSVAGMFTTSKAPSAPVDWCRKQLKQGWGAARALLVNAGFLYKTVYGDLIPRAHASLIELDSKKYSRDYGLSLRGQRPIYKSKIKAFAQITTGWRKFNNSRNLPFSSEQDGNYQRVEIGGDHQFDATTGMRLSAAFNSVDADQPYEGYDGYEVTASLTKVLPRGTFVLGSVTFEQQFYDGNDPFISARTRQDRDWEFDVTYGVPVGTVVGVFSTNPAGPAMLRPIVLNLTFGYESSHSNIPNYQYDNTRGQFMFNRSWDF